MAALISLVFKVTSTRSDLQPVKLNKRKNIKKKYFINTLDHNLLIFKTIND